MTHPASTHTGLQSPPGCNFSFQALSKEGNIRRTSIWIPHRELEVGLDTDRDKQHQPRFEQKQLGLRAYRASESP